MRWTTSCGRPGLRGYILKIVDEYPLRAEPRLEGASTLAQRQAKFAGLEHPCRRATGTLWCLNVDVDVSSMINPKTLDEISKHIDDALPEGLVQLRQDVKQNLRAGLEAALSRADLVTREEFDVQAAVLARTREKLTALEETVARLESELEGQEKS